MPEIQITRKRRYSKSIGGELAVDGRFVCYLELPWRWNRKGMSCIPAGVYHCCWRHDRGRVQLENIPCPEGYRVAIQIHVGNEPIPKTTTGCILVGTSVSPNFAHSSRDAMRLFERTLFGNEYGPGYSSKVMTLRIGGILMDSRFDNLDELNGV
jgi:hypothetical protein